MTLLHTVSAAGLSVAVGNSSTSTWMVRLKIVWQPAGVPELMTVKDVAAVTAGRVKVPSKRPLPLGVLPIATVWEAPPWTITLAVPGALTSRLKITSSPLHTLAMLSALAVAPATAPGTDVRLRKRAGWISMVTVTGLPRQVRPLAVS